MPRHVAPEQLSTCGQGGSSDVHGTDVFSRAKRSEVMSRVRNKNTKPELVVRSLLHSLGYRFRLHRNDLPGKPDIVLPKHRTVIFVHGCFWHQHENCRRARLPKQNQVFWSAKLAQNKERDRGAEVALKKLGWQVQVVWSCEAQGSRETLANKLSSFLPQQD